MKIAFVRHGMTSGNLRKAYMGVTDEALCETGVSALRESAVAETVRGLIPHCGQVYVSTRQRTQETASLLFPEMEQVVCSFLDEMDFGIFEGKNYEDLSHSPAYRAWVEGGCVAPCPQGEGLDVFLPRVRQGFLSVVGRSVDNMESSVNQSEQGKIFVVHGGTIMGICSQFVEGSTYYQWQVPCGEALLFQWEEGALIEC